VIVGRPRRLEERGPTKASHPLDGVETESLGVELDAALNIADVQHSMIQTLDRHGGTPISRMIPPAYPAIVERSTSSDCHPEAARFATVPEVRDARDAINDLITA
jgi:hypothetical protein